jgi:hypothetical protein
MNLWIFIESQQTVMVLEPLNAVEGFSLNDVWEVKFRINM